MTTVERLLLRALFVAFIGHVILQALNSVNSC
jgi:hypothetical protein